MRECSVPAVYTPAETANLTDDVVRNAAETPDHVCFSRRSAGSWLPLTAKDFAVQVKTLAAGLIAHRVQPGDRVAVMSKTSFEWMLCDYAIWFAGAVTVPIYETSSAEQVEWILADSAAVVAIVETAEHLLTVDSVRPGLADLREVWRIEVGDLDRVADDGRAVAEAEVDARREALGPDDLATIVYTSGTTGRPKGAELTHGNLVWYAGNVVAAPGIALLFNDRASTLLFLPLAHILARLIQLAAVHTRVRLGHAPNVKNLVDDLASFQPTVVLSVPRVFEKIYNTAQHKAHAEGKGRIFDYAESVAVAYSKALERGRPPLLLRLQHALCDRLVYGKLRAIFGGRVEWAVSGGAPLGARLGHFFRGIGVNVLEGWGLTETSAGCALNLPAQQRVGSVGPVVPGSAVRIADDGEILMRGGNVLRGYWRNEAATRAAFTDDGWFRTGDLGRLDDDGFLTITGRKKEIIVTAGGKNVAPTLLEDRLRAHRLVSQCIVVGDRRPYIAALVTIDSEVLPGWQVKHRKPAALGLEELRDDPELLAEISAAVDEANRAVSHAEAIRRFRILNTDFTEAGGQLTPTLKLKRAVIEQQFAADIEGLYS